MTDTGARQPAVVSRDALYSLVWVTLLNRLADIYGITGTGLAKICSRLDVPCPPRGLLDKEDRR